MRKAGMFFFITACAGYVIFFGSIFFARHSPSVAMVIDICTGAIISGLLGGAGLCLMGLGRRR